MNLSGFSAGGLSRLIQKKEVSALEVNRFFLDRAESLNPKINALVHLDSERILQNTKNLKVNPDKPFIGVPLPIKELTEQKGELTTYASRGFAGHRPTYTRYAVSQLLEAGFLPFGSSTSSEFGASCFTESLLNGITRNPWKLHLSPGGSSGGGAAALAAGLVPIAHGSDGGGSLRIPAAWCGVVGFKPSRGLVSAGPKLVWSMLSTQGVMTRNVEDQGLVLDVWNQPDPSSWSPYKKFGFKEHLGALQDERKGIKKSYRIGVQRKSPQLGSVDPEHLRVLDEVARQLKSLGHDVFDYNLDMGDPGAFVAFFQTLWASLIGSIPGDPSFFEPTNRLMWEMSRKQSAFDLCQAQNEAQMFSRKVTTPFGPEIDVLLCPTVPCPPPKAGLSLELSGKSPESLILKNWELSPFTPWANVSGQPALSLPMGRTTSGLPIGIQFVGGLYQDLELLQLAFQLESTIGYPDESGKCWPLAPLAPLV